MMLTAITIVLKIGMANGDMMRYSKCKYGDFRDERSLADKMGIYEWGHVPTEFLLAETTST
jgi:hypothetical protein